MSRTPMRLVRVSRPYSELLQWSLSKQLGYVRGFADGEGGPKFYSHRARNSSRLYPNSRLVVISNTDLGLLLTVQFIMRRVKIESRIYVDQYAGERKAKKDSYVLVIMRGQSLSLFAKLIGFTEPRKAETLLRIVRSYKRFIKTVKSG